VPDRLLNIPAILARGVSDVASVFDACSGTGTRASLRWPGATRLLGAQRPDGLIGHGIFCDTPRNERQRLIYDIAPPRRR
jgi:hypothetical protein